MTEHTFPVTKTIFTFTCPLCHDHVVLSAPIRKLVNEQTSTSVRLIRPDAPPYCPDRDCDAAALAHEHARSRSGPHATLPSSEFRSNNTTESHSRSGPQGRLGEGSQVRKTRRSPHPVHREDEG